MASERAKQLAAEQKAAVKAEKLRKKNSDNPKDWGAIRQFVAAFKVTREYDKPLIPLMLGGFLLGVGVFVVAGLFVPPWWMWLVVGIMFGLLAAMWILNWRAKVGMYKRFKGQPGAGEAAINVLPKTWVKQPVITVNRYQDTVHRVVGPGGIVLIGDGQPSRVREMLTTEEKRHQAIKYKVPVTALMIGEGTNQVPLEKLARAIKKLPKAIKPSEVTEVTARLKALDGSRPRIPIPKGPMPSMRGARSALRGR